MGAGPGGAAEIESSLNRLIDGVRSAIVAVEAYQPVIHPGEAQEAADDARNPGSEPDDAGFRLVISSGVLLEGGRQVVTIASGVDGCDSVVIRLQSGSRVPATLHARDADLDVALLDVDEEIPTVEALPAGPVFDELLHRRAWIAALGYSPGDEEPLFSIGKLTGVSYTRAGNRTLGMLMTSAPIFAGCTGGALVDMEGRWLGLLSGSCLLNTGYDVPEDLMFSSAPHAALALPVNEVMATVERLREDVRSDEAFLGVEIPVEGVSTSSTGVRVLNVIEDCPAHAAGLRRDDIIRRIDGNAVDDPETLRQLMTGKKPGDQASVEILREGRILNLDLVLGSRLRFEQHVRAEQREQAQTKQLKAMIRRLEAMLEQMQDDGDVGGLETLDASPRVDRADVKRP
jgi:S1-C subfamily serine protease